MIHMDGETYVTVTDALQSLRISRWMFYHTLKPSVQSYRVGAFTRPHYKLSELQARLQRVQLLSHPS